MRAVALALAGFGIAASFSAAGPSAAPSSPGAACRRCGWAPPATRHTVVVHNVHELHQAAREAKPDTTILLEDGEYRLESMLDLGTPHVVLRGKSGDPARVVLGGGSMADEQIGVAISISAPDVTIADLTAGQVGFHGVQVRGESGASRAVLHNVRIVDTGQQLVKGSVSHNGLYADDGLIACSSFMYTDHAPTDYTDGIDLIAVRHWTIRDNRFERIRGPEKNRSAGPAILVWGHSADTIVERNVVLDSFRGIALGLMVGDARGRTGEVANADHEGGVIRNNVIYNAKGWADEGIEVNSAPGARIEHNTVFVEGGLGWSISLRFPATSALVQNNLTNRRIILRDGGRGTLQDNIQNAVRAWFVNPAAGDFHLAGPGVPANVGAFESGARKP